LFGVGERLRCKQLFLNLLLNYSETLFGAACSVAPELNLRLQFMHSIFGCSEFHGKFMCQAHGPIGIVAKLVGLLEEYAPTAIGAQLLGYQLRRGRATKSPAEAGQVVCLNVDKHGGD
jgi:hypothetical protein